MSPTLAPAPARAPSRQRPGQIRPTREPDRARRHLRAVDPVGARATRGRPRVHIVLGVGVGSLFAVLFAVAVLQTVLVQGQIHLDGLQADVAEAEVRVQELRAEVGALESPGRVVEEVSIRGMVPAARVHSVVPRTTGGDPAP